LFFLCGLYIYLGKARNPCEPLRRAAFSKAGISQRILYPLIVILWSLRQPTALRATLQAVGQFILPREIVRVNIAY
jgi:hypothetical protein